MDQIPMDPEEFAKPPLNTPPGALRIDEKKKTTTLPYWEELEIS